MKRIYTSGGGVGKKSGGFSSFGTITPGTTNRITKYTNGPAGVIGDSNISDDGVLVTSYVETNIRGKLCIGSKVNAANIVDIVMDPGFGGSADLSANNTGLLTPMILSFYKNHNDIPQSVNPPIPPTLQNTINGEVFGGIGFNGVKTNNYFLSAGINGIQDGGSCQGSLTFSTYNGVVYSEKMRLSYLGNLLINRTSQLAGSPSGEIDINTSMNNALTGHSYSTFKSAHSAIQLFKSASNSIALVDTTAGDYLGRYSFAGVSNGGAGYQPAVDILAIQSNVGGLTIPADLIFKFGGAGDPATVERIRIVSAGMMLSGSASTKGNFAYQATQLNENETGFEAIAYSTTPTKTAALVLIKSHANTEVMGDTIDGEQLGVIRVRSTYGTGFRDTFELGVYQEGAASNVPNSNLRFSSCDSGIFSERMRLNAAGQLLINQTTAISNYKLQVGSLNTTENGGLFTLYSSDTAKYSKLILAKSAQNTIGFTNTGIGDVLGGLEFRNTFNGALYEAFELRAVQNEAASANAATYLSFRTNYGGANTERFRFEPIGLFIVYRDNTTIVESMQLENHNTTASNGNSIIWRTTTTGAGAASGQEMARIETVNTLHDHATRSAELNLYCTISGTEKKAIRCRPTANGGHVQITCGNVNPGSGDNQTVTMYLDEGGNTLKFRVVYGVGTVKTGTVTLI
jgi:hypothetical protein